MFCHASPVAQHNRGVNVGLRNTVVVCYRNVMNYLAENIRRLRARWGWSQSELAERAQSKSIKHIETGRITAPTAATMERLAEVFGVSVGYLYSKPRSK